jgi:hypothetical protein
MLNRADLKRLHDYFDAYDALKARVEAMEKALAAQKEQIETLTAREQSNRGKKVG